MSKKYLSLEEAAEQLSLSREELVRMRESGAIRGFADRGTWKFKVEDVESLSRSRQADSDPEVPLYSPKDAGDEASILSEDVGEQPTIISKSDKLKTSDSDVRLMTELGSQEDSAEMLVPHGTSDSDVRLMGEAASSLAQDSDSDINLVSLDSSDSDVKLVPDTKDTQGSDSDVQLIETGADDSSDSDVALLSSSDSAIALDFTPDEGEGASVLSDESGLVLSGDSALALASESGISLEGPVDSGISLDDSPDEGITLATGDSGISLDLASESGISLDSGPDSGISLKGDNLRRTAPMMDAASDDSLPETAFEIPSLSHDDSEFELQTEGDDSGDRTMMLNLDDSGETTGLDDAVFDLDEDEANIEELSDEMDVSSEVLGEDDELDELDVFDADDDVFEESGSSEEFAAPIGGRGAVEVEQEWGAGTFAGLLCSTVLLTVVGLVMFDLVHTMWRYDAPNAASGMVLDSLKGLYSN